MEHCSLRSLVEQRRGGGGQGRRVFTTQPPRPTQCPPPSSSPFCYSGADALCGLPRQRRRRKRERRRHHLHQHAAAGVQGSNSHVQWDAGKLSQVYALEYQHSSRCWYWSDIDEFCTWMWVITAWNVPKKQLRSVYQSHLLLFPGLNLSVWLRENFKILLWFWCVPEKPHLQTFPKKVLNFNNQV